MKHMNRVRTFFATAVSSFMGMLFAAAPVIAQETGELAQTATAGIEPGNTQPEFFAAYVIYWVLGVIALIAFMMFPWGAFNWMTNGGNVPVQESSRKTMFTAVGLLVFVFVVWGITAFVVNYLSGIQPNTIAPGVV